MTPSWEIKFKVHILSISSVKKKKHAFLSLVSDVDIHVFTTIITGDTRRPWDWMQNTDPAQIMITTGVGLQHLTTPVLLSGKLHQGCLIWHSNRVRLSPNGTNLGLFNISFSTF